MVSCTVKTTKCQNALFLEGTWFLGSGSELLIILGFMPYIFTPSWDVSWIPVLLQFKIRCFSFPLSLEEYTFLCKHTNLCPICARSRTITSQFNFYVQPLFPAPPDSYLFLNLSLISALVPYEPHFYIYIKRAYIRSKVYKNNSEFLSLGGGK